MSPFFVYYSKTWDTDDADRYDYTKGYDLNQ